MNSFLTTNTKMNSSSYNSSLSKIVIKDDTEFQDYDQLPDDMKFGADHVMMIVCYTVAFLISSIGNLIVLLIICRNLCSSRKNHRIHLLLLNLNIADLLVTFYCIPKDIVHSITVQWLGSDFLCRFSKYMDVFGIYASSNLLICMSIDRFFAIVKPLQNFNAKKRIKVMITVAWVSAALSGLPQVFTFQKAQHPSIRWYSQCISIHYLHPNDRSISNQILANTVINALEIYILPFTVILFCYISIMVTIVHGDNQIWRARNPTNPVSRSSSSNDKHQYVQVMRRSSHSNMRRAKSRTLKMTVVVVLTFLVCWTPYFIMVTLHFLRKNKEQQQQQLGEQDGQTVPAIVERFLYIFAIFNSCINPYIYGYYSFKLRRELSDLADFCCLRRKKRRQVHTPTVTTRSNYELSHTNLNECSILIDGIVIQQHNNFPTVNKTSCVRKTSPATNVTNNGGQRRTLNRLSVKATTTGKVNRNDDQRGRSVSMAPQALILN